MSGRALVVPPEAVNRQDSVSRYPAVYLRCPGRPGFLFFAPADRERPLNGSYREFHKTEVEQSAPTRQTDWLVDP